MCVIYKKTELLQLRITGTHVCACNCTYCTKWDKMIVIAARTLARFESMETVHIFIGKRVLRRAHASVYTPLPAIGYMKDSHEYYNIIYKAAHKQQYK